MISNDNMENKCNGQVDDLEKESSKKYSCFKCDKVYQHCSSFSRHMKSHKCITFFKRFSMKDVLKKHSYW